jgi:hypothetical protein
MGIIQDTSLNDTHKGREEFSEVGLPLYGVLRSSLPASNAQATPKIVYLSDTPASIREYATHVTDKGTP